MASDEKQNSKNNGTELEGIELEIAAYIKVTDQLIATLEKILPAINENKVSDPEAFIKVVKPLCITVENTLPLLNDLFENLDYVSDEHADELRRKALHLEEDLLTPLIDYISQHQKSSDAVIRKDLNPVC